MQTLQLDERDNVVVAIENLSIGQSISVDGLSFTMIDDVQRGHKVAIKPIERDADVIRYGEVIGGATDDIRRGEHVHVHNLISRRIPGRRT